MMRNFAVVAVVLTSLVPFAGAAASQLKPMQGGTFVLGDESASVYYTVSGNTFEVVTTIGPADGSGGPLRFIGYLQPGQRQIISAGTYGTTAPPEELVLTHEGDVLIIAPPAEELARRAAQPTTPCRNADCRSRASRDRASCLAAAGRRSARGSRPRPTVPEAGASRQL